MSVKISGLVWDSDLPRDEKFVALAYADHADHEGKNVFPGKKLVAKKTGYSRRSIEIITKQLLRDGVLVKEGLSDFGTINYRFDLKKLRGGEESSGSEESGKKGAKNLRSNHHIEPSNRDIERHAEKIYAVYPLKKGKPTALRAIKKQLKKHTFAQLFRATRDFAAARNGNLEFCPNPSTWFNQERFNDDPSTWKPNASKKEKSLPRKALSNEDYRRADA